MIAEESNDNTVSKTVSSASIVRYAAPEVIKVNGPSATFQSDTYSFAMLMLECITELPPFYYITRDAAVIHTRITKGQHPLPPDLKKEDPAFGQYWDLMKECWSDKPEGRPGMGIVHTRLLDCDFLSDDT
jgi:serine/threonine protein kinase